MPNQTQDITIPLSAGQREDIDPKVAAMFQGQPVIKSALNLLLRRDGRLGVRNGIAALNGFAPSGVHIQDVASCAGRLFGLGVFNNGSILDGAYELFEYVNATTGTVAWHASSNDGVSNAGVSPLNQCSQVRELASLGQVAGGVRNMDCAAGNGYVCIAYRATGESTTRINVYNAVTGAVVYASGTLSPTDLDVACVVCCDGGAFLIAGVNTADGSVSLYKFDPATDTALVTATDLFAAGAAVTAFAFAPVVGATGVAIGYIDRGAGVNATIHRCNTSGTLVGTDISIAGTNTIGAALVCDNVNVRLITVESGGVASLSTYLLSSGALTIGPTALFGSNAIVVGRGSPTVELCNFGFSNPAIFCGGQSTDANDLYLTRTEIRTAAAHALSTERSVFGASLETRAVASQLVSANQGQPVLWGSTMGGYAGHASEPRNNALWGYGQSLDASALSVGYHARLDPLEGDIGTGVLGCQGGFKDRVTNNIYWCARRVLPGGTYSGVLYEARVGRDDRRQMVPVPGGVFVPGGQPQVFDDICLSDAGGFPDIPDIIGLAESIGGSLTLLGAYQYVVVWEYTAPDRRRYRSRISELRTVTLTGANNRTTGRVSFPHSRRGNSPEQIANRGGRVVAAVYRTAAGGEIFRRAFEVEGVAANYGLSQSFIDTIADSALGEILYTSGDTGGLSGVFEDCTPFPCASVTVGKECIATCRLPNPRAYQLSKPYEALSPARWSDEDAFFGEAPDPLLACRFMDERLYLFAENAVYVASGSPPSVAGIVQGEELTRPQLLTAQCGIVDVSGRGMEWRSLLEDGNGLWWQSDTDKLMFLARGGAVPEWASRPVQSTLALFPVITGAACQTDDFTASWACRNVAGNDAVVIVRDARTGDWFVHDYNQDIVAICEHQDKLVFATASGTVFQQTSGFVDGASTFIPATLELATLYPAGPGGEARIHWVELLAEFRGDCVLEGFISYDDGVTYTSLGAVTLTTAGGYVAGQTILYQKGPARQKCGGFRLRFNVTTAGSATEGLVFNLVRCQVMATTGPTRKRLAA